MRPFRRNSKVEQRRYHLSYLEAQETLEKLNTLLTKPDKKGISVGEMVTLAASMGLLTYQRQSVAV
ncbi:MAG: hypothetical protein JW860_07255 [Sedimentisphaerales bacterium]|nr:hypothetical protein [Sedimentisphaerales bacterium]